MANACQLSARKRFGGGLLAARICHLRRSSSEGFVAIMPVLLLVDISLACGSMRDAAQRTLSFTKCAHSANSYVAVYLFALLTLGRWWGCAARHYSSTCRTAATACLPARPVQAT